MPQNEFQIGDVVTLKGNSGQKFVVFEVQNNMINCAFFSIEAHKVLHTGQYDYRLFTKVEQ